MKNARIIRDIIICLVTGAWLLTPPLYWLFGPKDNDPTSVPGFTDSSIDSAPLIVRIAAGIIALLLITALCIAFYHSARELYRAFSKKNKSHPKA